VPLFSTIVPPLRECCTAALTDVYGADVDPLGCAAAFALTELRGATHTASDGTG
jgi:hypothetical protein